MQAHRRGLRLRQSVTYLTRAAPAKVITKSLSVVIDYNTLVGCRPWVVALPLQYSPPVARRAAAPIFSPAVSDK